VRFVLVVIKNNIQREKFKDIIRSIISKSNSSSKVYTCSVTIPWFYIPRRKLLLLRSDALVTLSVMWLRPKAGEVTFDLKRGQFILGNIVNRAHLRSLTLYPLS
jgi:hypothetical protein